jgi:uncharacterized membrane protein YjjP (DUF1212 family)
VADEGAARPAFYALAPGGWRDYVTLLHPPYTLWHLSYVVVGAAIAPEWRPGRLGIALGAFFLGLGIGAHALDELHGRPLQTRIPTPVLAGLAAASIAGGAALGIYAALEFDLWLLAFVAVGAFIVCAYNLEWFGGRLHGGPSFALAWGALPVLTSYLNASGRIRLETVAAAGFAALGSHAQRLLSTQVRRVRREIAAVSGTIELRDGRREALGISELKAAPEAALRVLGAAFVILAVALVLTRVA